MKTSYIYSDGQILSQRIHNDQDPNLFTPYYYVHDRLGSVRLMLDNSGTAVNSYTYKPYGSFHESEIVEAVANPWAFTGQYYDAEIAQYYLRARQYDPAMMRFTSRDKVKGDEQEPLTQHRYLYCINDPIDYTDLTGKSIDGTAFAIIVGSAVHNTAVDMTAAGVASGNDFLLTLGIIMNDLTGTMMDEARQYINNLRREPEFRKYQLAGTVGIGLHHYHHVFPKFLGGFLKGKTVEIPVEIHQALHKELYRRLNRHFGGGQCNWSGKKWQGMIGNRMNEAIDILIEVSEEFDNNYGLVESLLGQLREQGRLVPPGPF